MNRVRRFFFIFVAITFSLVATDFIPLDDRVTVGKLDNGITYYIQNNDFPKEGASIRLVVKAGSLHEQESERGIAHFLEHMNFRGSKNVKDWEMIRYLESVGAKFGADTNAYTSFTHTVYQLELPKAAEEVVERGLFILGDMAGRANIDQDLVEKERKVIIDEYNSCSKNAHSRLITNFFTTFCGDSLYNSRMPIGLKEVILGADAAKIRGFYEKWYRPERMAVVVVGDCDALLVEKWIKEYFGYLEAKGEEPKEPSHEVEFPQERVITGFIDSELSEHTIGLYFFQGGENSASLTREGLKKGIIAILLRELLDQRFESLCGTNPPPFLSCGMSGSEFLDEYEMVSIGAAFFEERPLDALYAIYREIAKLQKMGPTKQEFLSLTAALREGVVQMQANEERTEHTEFADNYVSHFLESQPFYRQNLVLEEMLLLLEEITAEDIRLLAEKDLMLEDFHLFFTGAQEGILTKEVIEEFFSTMGEFAFEEQQEEIMQEFTISSEVEQNLCFEQEYKEGYTVFSLENGLKVVLHPTTLEKDHLLFTAFALGGKTLFEEQAYPALAVSCEYMLGAGLGNLTGKELAQYFNEKNIGYNCSVFSNMRTIQIQGNPKYFEEYCRLFLATFQARKRNPNVLENIIVRNNEIVKQQRNNPLSAFTDKAQQAIFSSHPFYQRIHKGEVSLEEVEEVLHTLFLAPEEYILVIVGDFSLEEIKPVLLRYLNYQKEKQEKPIIALPSYSFPDKDVQEEIRTGVEASCFTYVVYGLHNFPIKPKEFSYPLQGLKLLLEDRLLTKMRQEMGEIYTCSIFTDFPLYPSSRDLFIYFYFSCEEGKESLLKEVLQQELSTLLEKGIEEKELERLKALMQADSKKLYQYNSGWVSAHQDHFLWDLPLFTEQERLEEIDYAITEENILHLAKLLFENRTKVEITRLSTKNS